MHNNYVMNTKQNVKRVLEDTCDKVIAKKDGTFAARYKYFYGMGKTAESFADRVTRTLDHAHIKHEVIERNDVWRAWPTDSYFECIFRLVS